MKCLLCGRGKGEVQNSCNECYDYLQQGYYFLLLISDKSEKNKIRRLGKTFVVSREELEQAIDMEEVGKEQIIFIRENEAKSLGLLEEDNEQQEQDTT